MSKYRLSALVGAPDFNHRTTGTLMAGLAVDTVAAAVVELWERCGKDGQDSASVS